MVWWVADCHSFGYSHFISCWDCYLLIFSEISLYHGCCSAPLAGLLIIVGFILRSWISYFFSFFLFLMWCKIRMKSVFSLLGKRCLYQWLLLSLCLVEVKLHDKNGNCNFVLWLFSQKIWKQNDSKLLEPDRVIGGPWFRYHWVTQGRMQKRGSGGFSPPLSPHHLEFLLKICLHIKWAHLFIMSPSIFMLSPTH